MNIAVEKNGRISYTVCIFTVDRGEGQIYDGRKCFGGDYQMRFAEMSKHYLKLALILKIQKIIKE